MSLNTFKTGDRVFIAHEGLPMYGVSQTVVAMSGDYVRIRLDENVGGLAKGLISSWLPGSLRRIDPRTETLGKFRGHHGGMEIVSDPHYPSTQVWVQTAYPDGKRGPEFNLSVEDVTALRNVLDVWLKGQR